jgi:mono/diheme cytochrome c family protein
MLAFVSSVVVACEENVDYPRRTVPAGLLRDAAQRTAGEELFLEKCASCHGKPSEGRSARADFFEPAAPDFHEVRYRQVEPDYLYWRIEAGKTVEPYLSQGSVMPAWGEHLTERQIWQLVAYIKSRSE